MHDKAHLLGPIQKQQQRKNTQAQTFKNCEGGAIDEKQNLN